MKELQLASFLATRTSPGGRGGGLGSEKGRARDLHGASGLQHAADKLAADIERFERECFTAWLAPNGLDCGIRS